MGKSIILDATHFGLLNPTGVERVTEVLLPLLSYVLLQRGYHVAWISNQKIAIPDGVKLHHSPHSLGWGQLRLAWELHCLKPELYFTTSGVPPILYSGKMAMFVHDMASYIYPQAFALSQKLKMGWLSKKAAAKASTIIVPSQFTANCVQQYWPQTAQKIKVVPEALLENKAETESIKGIDSQSYILYIGRLEEKKNLITLIQAYARVKDTLGIKLVLAGSSGFGIEEIKRAAKGQDVTFTGYVSDGQKKWLLENALALAVPCPVEGFGLPVLEGFAASVPVIAARAGSLPEVAGTAARLVDPFSVNQWAESIVKVVKEDALRQDMIKAGQERLKMYNWDKTAREIADTLTEVINK